MWAGSYLPTGLLLEVHGRFPLLQTLLETFSCVPVHMCVSPGGTSGLRGCPYSDLPSGLPVCSPTLTRFRCLEQPLWAAASGPLSLANLCPGSHSSHSISPQSASHLPRPAQLAARPSPPGLLRASPSARTSGVFWVLLFLLQIPLRWVASSPL